MTKIMSRRQQKKAADKSRRVQSSRARDEADAATRNSRASHFHRILSRPGRGGLTAKGAQQLQQFFSKKVPETDKPKMHEMDASATMSLLQMAVEEVDAGEMSYGNFKQAAEANLIVNGAEAGKGAGEDAKAEEDVGMEEVMEAEEDPALEKEEEVRDEDWMQGGVVLANDL